MGKISCDWTHANYAFSSIGHEKIYWRSAIDGTLAIGRTLFQFRIVYVLHHGIAPLTVTEQIRERSLLILDDLKEYTSSERSWSATVESAERDQYTTYHVFV